MLKTFFHAKFIVVQILVGPWKSSRTWTSWSWYFWRAGKTFLNESLNYFLLFFRVILIVLTIGIQQSVIARKTMWSNQFVLKNKVIGKICLPMRKSFFTVIRSVKLYLNLKLQLATGRLFLHCACLLDHVPLSMLHSWIISVNILLFYLTIFAFSVRSSSTYLPKRIQRSWIGKNSCDAQRTIPRSSRQLRLREEPLEIGFLLLKLYIKDFFFMQLY